MNLPEIPLAEISYEINKLKNDFSVMEEKEIEN